MTSKVNIILGLVVSTLLFITLPTTVYAKTVSSGDALYANEFVSPKMMSLSPVSTLSTEDYGVATLGTYYANTSSGGSKTVLYRPSYTTGVDILSFDLFDLNLTLDSNFGKADEFRCVFLNGISINGVTNGMNYLDYDLWVIVDSTKVYLTGGNTWYGFKADNYISYDTCRFGIDLKFAPIFSSPSGSMTANSNNAGGYNITDNYLTRDSGSYISITWSDFEWGLYDTRNSSSYWNSKNNADMNSGMTNIFNRLGDLYNLYDSWSSTINDSIVNGVDKLHNEYIVWSKWILENLGAFRSEVLNYYNGMISNLDSWFTTLFEKIDNKHEEIINGYDSSTNNDSLSEVETTVNTATEQQDAINNDAFGYVDSYTIPSDGIGSYATQFLTVFPLVSSMMQSIFDSSGAFGIIFSVIFTMTIVCMVIGMFRFYKS